MVPEHALPDGMRCRGRDGLGRGQPDIPVLSGQTSAYLSAALEAYAAGRRSSAVMATAAARVASTALRALAEHYSALPGLPVPAAPTSSGSPAAPLFSPGLPYPNLPPCPNFSSEALLLCKFFFFFFFFLFSLFLFTI